MDGSDRILRTLHAAGLNRTNDKKNPPALNQTENKYTSWTTLISINCFIPK